MKVKVNTNPQATNVVSVGIQGPSGSANFYINEAQDVDITNIQNGSVLVYATQSDKWKATVLLDTQNIECGQY
jgi:hypothetical protein